MAPAKKQAEEKKVEYITVKSALEGNRVALHEVHPDHPPIDPDDPTSVHEVFVYGDKEFVVARTQEVDEHIARKELVEVK